MKILRVPLKQSNIYISLSWMVLYVSEVGRVYEWELIEYNWFQSESVSESSFQWGSGSESCFQWGSESESENIKLPFHIHYIQKSIKNHIKVYPKTFEPIILIIYIYIKIF